MGSDQLVLELDDIRLDVPWAGCGPRALAEALVDERIRLFLLSDLEACGVDNSVVRCPSREALRIGTDPAQLMICVAAP